jgi:hypothetical protein
VRRPWIAIVALVALAGACGAPQVSPAPRRAAYVGDVVAVATDRGARGRVVRLVRERRITDVIPYGMGTLLASAEGRAVLAAWIDEVHAAGGRVVAPVAGADRVRALALLVEEHPAVWFDGLVTEHEYWNRVERAAALDELLALLATMRAQAAAWAVAGRSPAIGAYLGYPTAAEARRLAAAVDFVFLDYSVRTPARAWDHVHGRGGPLRERFAWFAGAGVDVWPIFYAAGEVDMQAALRAEGAARAEARFRQDLAADAALGDRRVAGFVYFTVEAMPDPGIDGQ